ncbi:hypothetical protein PCO82_08640 [Pectobacteriaceae bacterium CE90]|nr:hypothetical protein PCO82_08640 [Pectobacteriaceae bacterium CE90]
MSSIIPATFSGLAGLYSSGLNKLVEHTPVVFFPDSFASEAQESSSSVADYQEK